MKVQKAKTENTRCNVKRPKNLNLNICKIYIKKRNEKINIQVRF